MIRILSFPREQQAEQLSDIASIPALLQDPHQLIWVDFGGEAHEVIEPILKEFFGFHQLAIDDALDATHVPKLDDWGEYLYIVLCGITYVKGGDDVEIQELDVFLGKNFLVTLHDLPIATVNRVWQTIQRDERHHKMGADHLLYKLSDEMVTDFMQAVEAIDDEIDWAEDTIFEKPSQSMVQRIFALKRTSLHLRRALSPLREVFNKLARDEYPMIDRKDSIYFRDVYDHLVRLHDISESLRDLVGGVLDTYLSVVSNRMNEIMKTLTIITTIFMPLSFVVGFFGMNFFVPDPPNTAWVSNPVFLLTLLLLLMVPVGMYAWMRRRGWM